jgi:hypothetical protein
MARSLVRRRTIHETRAVRASGYRFALSDGGLLQLGSRGERMPRHFRPDPARRLLLAALLAAVCACAAEEAGPAAIEGARKPDSALEAAATRQRSAAAALAPARTAAHPERQILFGDLHVHTTYSWDGFLFSLPLIGGEGAHPPADACDFARYCADLDFFALTDHAESMLPRDWAASKASVRQCNALAGDAESPDLVAFMGFEWSQAGLTPETHWGHRCVVFPGTAESELPERPITAGGQRELYAEVSANMAFTRWLQPWDWRAYSAYVDYLDALTGRPECPRDADVRALPRDCEEIAPTPRELNAKLDQWGFDSLAIPHGTTWGVYTPATSSIAKQLRAEQYDPERQALIEIMSGHGNSEVYPRWREFDVDASGRHVCREPTPDYLPCCWQAGEIMRSRCGDLPAAECDARVAEARQNAADAFLRPHNVFPDARSEEWLDCGQCRGCFKPSFFYRPRESVQYAMALADPDATAADGRPQRFRYGFVASSDGHSGRPGTGYKQIERSMMTDALGTPGFIFEKFAEFGQRMEDPQQPLPPRRERIGIKGSDARVGSFLYPGGLAAVHARGRGREAIWDALRRREVYGTSGPRILLWFELKNAGGEPAPMGAEVSLGETPRFEARAVGSFVQQPGCPDWSRRGLRPERLRRLCRDECYHPSDARHLIAAIEVIRIRPQVRAGEPVEPLIEDPWRTFPCAPDPTGCAVTFEDPEFTGSGRDALYYVRALQEPTPALNGSPLGTQLDANGAAVAIEPCWGDGERSLAGCPAPVQERAWSSPIFVNQPL